MRRFALLVAGLIAALAPVGCGGGGESATTTTETATEASKPQTQTQGRWVIADLGTLRGGDSVASAINDQGQIVGWVDTKAGSQPTFLWQDGRMRDLRSVDTLPRDSINNRGQVLSLSSVWENGKITPLGSLGGGDTQAEDINNRGQVVGTSYPNPEVATTNHGFLWENGKMIDLGTLGETESASDAGAINDRGQVVGSASTRAMDEVGNEIEHAFLWEDGQMRDLGTLGGQASEAVAINERGQVVGSAAIKARDENGFEIFHAFLWENGRMIDLGPPGADDGKAFAINERGQVLLTASGRWFVWQNGRTTPLPDVTKAADINASGQVVGSRVVRRTAKRWIEHAFLWQNGKMTDLDVLRARDTDSEALGINARGQVVGSSAVCGVGGGEVGAAGDRSPECHPRRAVLWTLKR